MTLFDGRAVITGIGQSDAGRRTGRSGMEHGIEGCLRAIADAGLEPGDIDGVASYPGPVPGEAGFVGATSVDIHDALGLRTNWHMAGVEGAAQIGPVVEACMAVSTGLADHVLCFRSVWESTAQQAVGRAASLTSYMRRAGGHLEYRAPFGAPSPVQWIAMYADRYMHDFGLSRDQLAQIALNGRRNAQLNPFVISRRESARSLPRPAITVESVGTALYERHSWDQRVDLTTMAAHDAAHSMWARTSIRPADVDVAELYDGFSYLTVQWLEALGFCEHGKVGD